MEKIRKNYVFYGNVQGVGFRYRAYYAAMTYGVTGWVHNNADGSVEAEFEGTEKDIDSVLVDIARSRYIDIENMQVNKMPVMGSLSFEIR